MAIYHLSVRQGSRAEQKSAVGKYDYVARLGEDHQRLDPILHAQNFCIPTWAENARKFWSSADRNERANARLYTEIEIALPRELHLQKNILLVNDFIKNNLQGCPTSYGIHSGSGGNPHAHIIFSERKWDGDCFDSEVFFKRNGAKKDRKFSDIKWLDGIRKEWEVLANIALEENAGGVKFLGKKLFQNKYDQIDCRSYADRGISRTPGRKLGARAKKKMREDEKNGKISTDGDSALSSRRGEWAQGYAGRARALYFDARKMRSTNSESGRDASRQSDGSPGHHPKNDESPRRGPGRPRKESRDIRPGAGPGAGAIQDRAPGGDLSRSGAAHLGSRDDHRRAAARAAISAHLTGRRVEDVEYTRSGYQISPRKLDAHLDELKARCQHIRAVRLDLEVEAFLDCESQRRQMRLAPDAATWSDADREQFRPVSSAYQADAAAIRELASLADRTRSMMEAIKLHNQLMERHIQQKKEAENRLFAAKQILARRYLSDQQRADAHWAAWVAAYDQEQERRKIASACGEMSEKIAQILGGGKQVSPSTEAAMKQLKKNVQFLKDYYDRKKIMQEIEKHETRRNRAESSRISRAGSGHRGIGI